MRTPSIAYRNIQRIFFLRHPNISQFYLVLQLFEQQSAAPTNGFDADMDAPVTHYSHVVLKIKGREKVALHLPQVYAPLLPEELVLELDAARHQKWNCYEAVAKTLQWLSRRRLTVSFNLLFRYCHSFK